MTARGVIGLLCVLGLAPSARAAAQDSARTILEPIDVSATADSATPFAVTTLGRADLARGRGAGLLDDVFERVAGLSAQGRGSFALDTRLVIRGAGGRAPFGVRGITVLLDGVPQTLADGQANLSQVDPATLASAEVLRGLAGAQYGNASGGVLALHSPDPLGPRTLRVRGAGGSDGYAAASAFARLPVGPGGLTAAVSSVRQDGWRRYAVGELRQAAVAGAWLPAAAWRIGASIRVSDLVRADNPGALDAAQLAADPRAAQPRNVAFAAGKTARETQWSLHASRLGAGARSDVVVFAIDRDLDNPLPTSWVRLDRLAAGARYAGRWQLGRLELLAGAELLGQRDDRINLDNDSGVAGTVSRLDQRERVASWGIRAAAGVPAGRGRRLVTGVRFDAVQFRVADRLPGDGDASGNRRMHAISAHGAVTGVARGWRYRIGIASGFDTPTTTELARPGVGGFTPTLRPQRPAQLEAGVSRAAGHVEVSVAAYLARVRDALVPREDSAAPGRFLFVNAGRVHSAGVEVEARWQATGSIRLAGAGTLARHRYASFPTDSTPLDGRAVPGVPAVSASLALDAVLGRGLGAAATLVTSGPVWADDANSARADGWTQLHARLERSAGRLRPFVSVRNLLDARAVASVNVNGALRRFFEPAAGRSWYVGLEIAADQTTR